MSTTPHRCDDRCSWTLTPARLTALGYTLQETGKVCGCTIVTQRGMSLGEARYEAWAAGQTRLCTRGGRS